jgi:hypothetical protein
MPCQDRFVRAGATSHNAIAAKLNERNVRTARGGVWTHVQVGAILHPFDPSVAVASRWAVFGSDRLLLAGSLPSVSGRLAQRG